MTEACVNPKRAWMRRDPEEMGLTLAFPAAAPQDVPREEATGRVEQIAPSDGELIQRIGSGDAGAFELIYRRYARPVFGLALRRLGDRMAAEEAVQETFASLWRSARTYKPERGPGAPWLYAVARNAIVDRASSGPRTAQRRPTSPGACTGRSRISRAASATCSSSRTGAGCRRARSLTFSASRSGRSRHAHEQLWGDWRPSWKES